MTQRLIITGVDGFVGRHLARIAAEDGIDVIGVSRSESVDKGLARLLSDYHSADLRLAWPAHLPDEAPVVHLAGLAAVGASFERPQDYIESNSAIVTHLGEARLAAGSSARVIGVSSGAVYGQDSPMPLRSENDPVAFTSPYAVSKILVENQLAYYRRRGIDTVVARPFNHIGPGQGTGFLVPDLLARLRALAPGSPLSVGNLSTSRDYSDVRDVARAYLRLAFAPMLNHTLYNVASGKAHSGGQVLEALCKALGRDIPPVTADPSKIRATDPASIVGDATRLSKDTGWAPEIDFTETISDVVAAR